MIDRRTRCESPDGLAFAADLQAARRDSSDSGELKPTNDSNNAYRQYARTIAAQVARGRRFGARRGGRASPPGVLRLMRAGAPRLLTQVIVVLLAAGEQPRAELRAGACWALVARRRGKQPRLHARSCASGPGALPPRHTPPAHSSRPAGTTAGARTLQQIVDTQIGAPRASHGVVAMQQLPCARARAVARKQHAVVGCRRGGPQGAYQQRPPPDCPAAPATDAAAAQRAR